MSSILIGGCDGEVTGVKKGQVATMEVGEGEGFVRRPVPEDGLLLDLKSETLFLPASTVRAALRGEECRAGSARLRLVKKGDSVMVESNGGFCRRTVSKGGLLIGTRYSSILLPAGPARHLLSELEAPSPPRTRLSSTGQQRAELER